MSEMTQREYWNTAAGEHWAAEADRYDALLGPFGNAILEAASLAPGQRVLDVGCGNGGVSLEIAARVTPDGSVVGVDLSEPMLAVARSRAAERGVENAIFVQDDVQHHPFEPGSFDRIVSRFGVMFFDDPVAAFANMRGCLAPSGRLTFVCWQDLLLNDWILVPAAALIEHVGMPEPQEPGGPGPFSLADEAHLRKVLEDAGWREITTEARSVVQPLGETVDEAYDFFVKNDVIKGMLADKPADKIEAALASLGAKLGEHLTPRGVELKGSVWLVSARP